MPNFPGSLDALVTLTSSTKMNDSGYEGDTLVNILNRIAEALEAKLGTGGSTPTAGNILAATGAGTSAWAATIAINGSLAPGAVSGTPAQHALYRENVIKGWINFNGVGTIAINDSFNVSGITDNGVGDYTVTWDRDFANANYGAGAIISAGFATSDGGITVGDMHIFTYNVVGAQSDSARIHLIVVGDQ